MTVTYSRKQNHPMPRQHILQESRSARPRARPDSLFLIVALLGLVRLALLAPGLIPADLNLTYPFVGGDSHDWIANGLRLAGEDVRYSGRSPLLPLVIALLYRLSALSWLPLLLQGLFLATVLVFYRRAARLFPRGAAGVAGLARPLGRGAAGGSRRPGRQRRRPVALRGPSRGLGAVLPPGPRLAARHPRRPAAGGRRRAARGRRAPRGRRAGALPHPRPGRGPGALLRLPLPLRGQALPGLWRLGRGAAAGRGPGPPAAADRLLGCREPA